MKIELLPHQRLTLVRFLYLGKTLQIRREKYGKTLQKEMIKCGKT